MLDTPVFRAVRELRGCAGLSVWGVRDGVPSTLLALDRSDHEPSGWARSDAAVLDAVQFAHSGPGTDALSGFGTVDAPTPQVLRERWALFAAASEARGVRAAVAVPFGTRGSRAARADRERRSRLLGVVVLYLTRPTLVDLALVRLAETVGLVTLLQEAPTAARERAAAGAGRGDLHEQARLGLAGILLERAVGLAPGTGRDRLRDAAGRAGIAPVALAEAVAEVLDVAT